MLLNNLSPANYNSIFREWQYLWRCACNLDMRLETIMAIPPMKNPSHSHWGKHEQLMEAEVCRKPILTVDVIGIGQLLMLGKT